MKQTNFTVNGELLDRSRYGTYHDRRMEVTLETLRGMGAKRVIELGGHPWVMTAHLVESGEFEVCATVSAEEVSYWPDDIPLAQKSYTLTTASGREASFVNYSANLERRRFDIPGQPDTVIACEILEHLVRAPHVMLLNINSWLPVGGKLLLTTPNGAQFKNPLRVKAPFPGYRCHLYERHQYLYTMDGLVDLISLCGFKVTTANWWDVYSRGGMAKLYGLLGKIPLRWFRERFTKSLCIIAEKTETVNELSRLPRVCLPSPDWEFVKRGAPGGAGEPME